MEPRVYGGLDFPASAAPAELLRGVWLATRMSDRHVLRRRRVRVGQPLPTAKLELQTASSTLDAATALMVNRLVMNASFWVSRNSPQTNSDQFVRQWCPRRNARFLLWHHRCAVVALVVTLVNAYPDYVNCGEELRIGQRWMGKDKREKRRPRRRGSATTKMRQ